MVNQNFAQCTTAAARQSRSVLNFCCARVMIRLLNSERTLAWVTKNCFPQPCTILSLLFNVNNEHPSHVPMHVLQPLTTVLDYMKPQKQSEAIKACSLYQLEMNGSSHVTCPPRAQSPTNATQSTVACGGKYCESSNAMECTLTHTSLCIIEDSIYCTMHGYH